MGKWLVEEQAVLPVSRRPRPLFDAVSVEHPGTGCEHVVVDETGERLLYEVVLDDHVVVAERHEMATCDL